MIRLDMHRRDPFAGLISTTHYLTATPEDLEAGRFPASYEPVPSHPGVTVAMVKLAIAARLKAFPECVAVGIQWQP